MSSKVTFIIGTLSNGGAERVVSNLSSNLSEEIDKEIILFGKDAKIDYNYKGQITYLDRDDSTNLFFKINTLIKRIIKLNKIKKTSDGLTISFMEYPNLLNILSRKNHKSIISVRNFMSSKHKKGLKAFFWNLSIKHLYKKARKIIVVSEQMKLDLIEKYKLPKSKIKVIYNSYPIQNIEVLAEESLTEKEKQIFDKPTIITAGRLSKQKGQLHLLRAFKQVKKKIPEAQLVFLGEGILRDELKEVVKEWSLCESVHFLGFQKNPFKYISQSKMFVMTSYYEGFPNALAEAMVCKVPVISTDCPSGPREIICPSASGETVDYTKTDDKYGFLVPAFNNRNVREVENQISKLIIMLINNSETNDHYSKKSFERIQEFDIKKIIKEWQGLFNK